MQDGAADGVGDADGPLDTADSNRDVSQANPDAARMHDAANLYDASDASDALGAGDTGVDAPVKVDAPVIMARIGQACGPGIACAMGWCVDGVCCLSEACGTCARCEAGVGACVYVQEGQEDPDTCANGRACGSVGRCLLVLGAECASGDQCASGYCADGRCCDSYCDHPCQTCAGATPGRCTAVTSGEDLAPRPLCRAPKRCFPGMMAGAGVCLLPDGVACSTFTECYSQVCAEYFVDADNDTYGNSRLPRQRLCGETPPRGRARRGGDCNDANELVNPGQTMFQVNPIANAPMESDYDYNCDGVEQLRYPERSFWTTGGFNPANSVPGCGEERVREWQIVCDPNRLPAGCLSQCQWPTYACSYSTPYGTRTDACTDFCRYTADNEIVKQPCL